MTRKNSKKWVFSSQLLFNLYYKTKWMLLHTLNFEWYPNCTIWMRGSRDMELFVILRIFCNLVLLPALLSSPISETTVLPIKCNYKYKKISAVIFIPCFNFEVQKQWDWIRGSIDMDLNSLPPKTRLCKAQSGFWRVKFVLHIIMSNSINPKGV